MSTPIVMPSFGMYTAEGTVVNWLHADGTKVTRGEPILEIETEKAVNQVIAPDAGILHQVASIGTLVKEQGLLGYILAEGENPPVLSISDALNSSGGHARPQPSMLKETVIERQIRASPVARRLATANGISLETLVGTGPEGRIVEADVRAAIESIAPSATNKVSLNPEFSLKGRRIALPKMRRVIGERLRRSVDTALSLTLTRESHAATLAAFRKDYHQMHGIKIPYDAFFVKILALALREHQDLNVVIEGDTLVILDDISIALAIQVPKGLFSPVIRNADQASLINIAQEIRRLNEEIQLGRLGAEHIIGGSSTVTNLGAFGVDIFTPILNPPQASILGIGRILQRPIASNGVYAVTETCWLSLTFDHRVCDGAYAATVLESIERMMNDRDLLSTSTES